MGNKEMATTGATKTNSKPNTLNAVELCKTTGWYNNCGLNSLTHFMYAKLSAIPAELFPHFLEENPEYNALLATFKRYYELNKEVTWQDVLGLLRNHPVPTDKEAIFAPVLRAHLGKVIAQNPDESWGYDAMGAISDFIKNGRVEDVAGPFYASNKEFYDSLRADYQCALSNNLKNNANEQEITQARKRLIEKNENPSNKMKIENYQPEGLDILLNVIEYRKIQLESQYNEAFANNWAEQGCRRYAEYVANMNNRVMVTAPHLMHLCQSLNIGVEVYSPAGLASRSEQQFPWLFKVLNSGLHWTFEEPDNNKAAVALHNRHYEAGRTNEMLGKYKIYTAQASSKDRMIAEVRCLFGEMTVKELEELKQVELMAVQMEKVTLQLVTQSATQDTVLKPHVHVIWDASKEGKEYIELILKNNNLLKLVNEQFDVALTCTFIQSYGAIVDKIKTRNAQTQVAFFEGFIQNARRNAANEVSAVLCGTPPVLHVPPVVIPERVGIKRAYFAILEQDDKAKQMIERIEKNPAALDSFNNSSEPVVRAFVHLCNIPNRLEGILNLDPAKLSILFQQLAAKVATKVASTNTVKPNL
jgi:hypothetical protein